MPVQRMEVYPLRSDLIQSRSLPVDKIIISALSKIRLTPQNGDVLAVTSKIVAVQENSLVELSRVRVGTSAKKIAETHQMDTRLVQVALNEADSVYRAVKGAILTVKDGDAVANSGADQKNSPPGTIVLWPSNPDLSARKIRKRLEGHYRKSLGVIIVDSRVTPLRLGTIGLALACAGFDPVRDLRGEPDLYGRKTRITTMNLADGIADAAHLVMGESDESIPFALVRNAPVVIDGKNRGKKRMLIDVKDCLYMNNLPLKRMITRVHTRVEGLSAGIPVPLPSRQPACTRTVSRNG